MIGMPWSISALVKQCNSVTRYWLANDKTTSGNNLAVQEEEIQTHFRWSLRMGIHSISFTRGIQRLCLINLSKIFSLKSRKIHWYWRIICNAPLKRCRSTLRQTQYSLAQKQRRFAKTIWHQLVTMYSLNQVRFCSNKLIRYLDVSPASTFPTVSFAVREHS